MISELVGVCCAELDPHVIPLHELVGHAERILFPADEFLEIRGPHGQREGSHVPGLLILCSHRGVQLQPWALVVCKIHVHGEAAPVVVIGPCHQGRNP